MTRRHTGSTLIAALLGLQLAAAPAAAATPAAQAAAQPAQGTLARQIVDLMEPDDVSLAGELRGWEIGIRGALARDPGIAKLSAAHPGMVDAAVAAARPKATFYLRDAIRRIKAKKAEILTRRLSTAELRQVHAFVSSDVGQRFYKRLHAKSDIGKIADDVLNRAEESGNVTITDQDARKVTGSALRGVSSETSSQDLLAILKFQQTAGAKRMAEISPEVTQAILDVANHPDPQWMQEQNELLVNAIVAFAEGQAGKPQ